MGFNYSRVVRPAAGLLDCNIDATKLRLKTNLETANGLSMSHYAKTSLWQQARLALV